MAIVQYLDLESLLLTPMFDLNMDLEDLVEVNGAATNEVEVMAIDKADNLERDRNQNLWFT